MGEHWVTVAEATKVLGVSQRRIWDGIKAGKYRVRSSTANGCLEVFVARPEGPQTPQKQLQDRLKKQEAVSDDDLKKLSETVVVSELKDRVICRDLEAARRSASFGWLTVSILVVASLLGMCWVMRKVTRGTIEVQAALFGHTDTAHDARNCAERLGTARKDVQDKLQEILEILAKTEEEKARLGISLTEEQAAIKALQAILETAKAKTESLAAKVGETSTERISRPGLPDGLIEH